MASSDGKTELEPLEQDLGATPAQGKAGMNDKDSGVVEVRATDGLQPGNSEYPSDVVVKAEERQLDDTEHQSDLQLLGVATSAQAQPGDSSHEPVESQQEPSDTAPKQMDCTTSTSRVLADVLHEPTVPQEDYTSIASEQTDCTGPTSRVPAEVLQAEAAEHQPHDSPANTPEPLRENSYVLSGSLAVASHESEEQVDKDDETMADARDEVTMSQDMQPHTTNHSESEGGTRPAPRRQESPHEATNIRSAARDPHESSDDQGEEHGEEHTMSINGESSDQLDASDNEEHVVEESHVVAQLRARIRATHKALLALEQDHESHRHGHMELQTVRHGNNSNSQSRTYTEIGDVANLNDYRASQQGHQPPTRAIDARGFVPPYSSGPHDMVHSRQHNATYPSPLQLPRRQYRSMSNNFMQDQMYMPPAAPSMYSDPGLGFQQYPALGPMDYQNMQYSGQSYSGAPLHQGYSHLPLSPYEMPAQRSIAAPLNDRPWNLAMPVQRNTQSHRPQQHRDVEEDDSTDVDDDKPLRTRAPPRQAVLGNSDESSPAPALKTPKQGKLQDEDNESDIEIISSKPSMGFKARRPKNAAPNHASEPRTPQDPESLSKEYISSNSPINWKLPKYEATFEPPKTKDDTTVARISIPGLVREEILLSPDHAEQETHLLLNVFMPTQQALATPDPSPAQAVLNFHTIAVMVIEAYIQFEIGDEFGTGRGHWHSDHDRTDTEYKRLRDAKDADTDEIFFAVIDRWRAGLESNKQPSKMIRGAQEFCDAALDVVFYIKENGLLASEKKKEEERVKKEKEEKKATPAGTKRGAQKVSEPTVRKKVKTGKEKVPEKKKGRTKTAAITVIRRSG
jgi:hypothetical protein